MITISFSPYQVINLGAHTSLLTAVANDIGGEMIFAQQVLGFGQKGSGS